MQSSTCNAHKLHSTTAGSCSGSTQSTPCQPSPCKACPTPSHLVQQQRLDGPPLLGQRGLKLLQRRHVEQRVPAQLADGRPALRVLQEPHLWNGNAGVGCMSVRSLLGWRETRRQEGADGEMPVQHAWPCPVHAWADCPCPVHAATPAAGTTLAKRRESQKATCERGRQVHFWT